MKKTIISALVMLACFGFGAYGQSDISLNPDAPVAEAPAETSAPEVQSEYNTPSRSYKAERNYIRSGNSYYEKEQYHQALEAYDKALQVNEGSIRARFNKARTLVNLASDDNKGTENDPREQARQLWSGLIEDAKKYDPEIAQMAYYDLGNMFFNDEQYDGSIAMYKSALRMKPDDMAARENLRLAQLKKQEQENQDQNQDQNQQDQQQQQQQQQQQDQQEQQEQEQQQQQQQQPMTQSAQQILQSMQNKENSTRKKVQEQETPAGGRSQSDKPW
ncbi:MAG: tetratricopeptide repeat protein [Bacteroidales bacterium]|nr:tetratricopeptide repeat protein [Bacteroidales bacterium]